MAQKRLPSLRDLREQAERLPKQATSKLATGSHFHTAELYGESETRGLRPWAKRAVLARAAF